MSPQNTWNTRSRKLNLKNQLRTQHENLGRLIIGKGYLESAGNPMAGDSEVQEILKKIKELEKSLGEI